MKTVKILALLISLLALSCGQTNPKVEEKTLPNYTITKIDKSTDLVTVKVVIQDSVVSKEQLILTASHVKEENKSKMNNIHFYSSKSDINGISQFSILYNENLNNNNYEIEDRTAIVKASNLPYFVIRD